MRVSLAPARGLSGEAGAALLSEGGPDCVLGWDSDCLAAPIVPGEASFFGPRGVCLHPDGSLWLADTGHHRILGWRSCPCADNVPAEVLIGQPDFGREGRNAGGEVASNRLNVPTGICAYGGGLAVADAWNHRVLIWKELPWRHDSPADIVLGQADFGTGLANRGSSRPSACSLHWPYGVSASGERLFVCDTGNRRVLVWDMVEETGQPANLVLGQRDFSTRDENAGASVSMFSMRWPHQALSWGSGVAVADAGNNRVMLWESLPQAAGESADHVLGQQDGSSCDHNMGLYYPTSRCLNMPYGLALSGGRLIVADTANSRVIGWSGFGTGVPADRLSCQPDFASKGDNRWGFPVRDSLCWPYGLSSDGVRLAIADSGNNRVLLWRLAG